MHTMRYETAPNGYRPQYAALMPPPPPPPPQPQPPRPAPGARTAVTTLVVLASLFLVSAGVFVTLFLMANADHDSAVKRLEQQQSALTDVNDQIASAEAERRRADDRNKALKSDNTDLSGCVDAMRHYLWDGLTDSARTVALRAVLAKCK